MAESQTTRAIKRASSKPAESMQHRVETALKQASKQAKKQLAAQGLKLPTQNWVGSAVKHPAA